MNNEDLVLFLHDQGYTFFDEPNLIWTEIISLINAKNRRMKNEERAMKRAKRRRR